MPAITKFLTRSGLAMMAAALMSPAAQADYFEWESWQDNASSRGGRAVQLVLHVPETDNVKFQAACRPAGVSARLGYNIGRRPENTGVSLSVQSAGYSAGFNGQVRGTQQEEGLVGVELRVNIKDPFWLALEEQSLINYRIGAEPGARLDLTGSGPMVRKFIDGCKALLASVAAAGTKPASPAPAKPAAAGPGAANAGSLSCKSAAGMKSRESRTPVTVTFVNKSEGYRGLTWINFQGQPVDFSSLDAGKSYRVKTYLSHVWMFTDGPGNCIEMFTPQPGMTRFEITTPSPAFGPGND